MKLTAFLSCLAMITPALGTEPDQIAAARRTYERQVEAAVAPIRQAYVSKLQQIMAEFTKAGRLDEALTARKALSEAGADVLTPPITGTSWKWKDGKQFTFGKDGLIHHQDWGKNSHWEYVGSNVVIVTPTSQSRHDLIRFSKNFESFTGWDYDGSKLPTITPWK